MNKFEFNSKRINFQDSEIQTYSFGTGSKIIFSFPSFATPGLYYLFFSPFYNHKNFKIVTFDIPGWGGLSHNIFKDKPFSIDTCVDIAKEVMDSYDIKSCNIIGYSYGGAMSIRFLERHPNIGKNIALVSPVAFHSVLYKHRLYKLLRAGSFSEKMRIPLGPLLTSKIINYLFSYEFNSLKNNVDEEIINFSIDLFKKYDKETLFNSLEVLFNSDFSESVKLIKNKYKFLVINSEEEWKFFRRQSEHLRYLLNNEESFKIKGKHEDFLARPTSETVEKVMTFLTN